MIRFVSVTGILQPMRLDVTAASVTKFDAPKQSLSGLGTEAVAALLSASADVVLVLDGQGVIRDVSSSNGVLANVREAANWTGKAWQDTVTIESKSKIERLLKEADNDGRISWRQVNVATIDGPDLPLSFCALRVGPKGRTIALGRDLRSVAELQQQLVDAQQALERDYLRLRHLESRYRILFDLTGEGVLVVDGKNMKIIETNPAAAAIIGDSVLKVIGRNVLDCVDGDARSTVAKLLDTVHASGQPDQISVKVGGERCTLSVSVMHEEAGELFLLRLGSTVVAPVAGADARAELVLRVLEQTPDAFVVTNNDGDILAVNRAFAEMVQLGRAELALGESLDRWLGRAGIDLNVLLANLRQRGHVKLFATTLRSQNGGSIPVEISAASVPHSDLGGLGFTIRDVGRRLVSEGGRHDIPQSAEQLSELVGRVPLREIVGETTDLIEKLAIEAALKLTQDNRATAAEILGLSRQSLYVKLRQYGIGGLGGD
jgi:transcriptional regulator PpsR